MKTIILIMVVTLLLQSLNAQVVNIEDKRIKTDTSGWSGTGEASVFMNKNNDYVLSLMLDLHIQYKTKKSLFLLLTDIASVAANTNEQFVNSGFEHFRYNYKITDRFVWEAFVQGQYNGPLSIEHRFLVGTGPRFKLVGTDDFRMYIASLYMFENEKNEDVIQQQYNNRMSSYVSFTITPNDRLTLVSTTYYQPKLDDFKDRRISTSFSMKSYFTKQLYVNLKYNLLDDSVPAVGVTETTYELTAGLGLKF